MTATMIPTREVAVDDLMAARDALEFRSGALRRAAHKHRSDAAKHRRYLEQATRDEKRAERIDAAVHASPPRPNVPGDLHTEA